VKEGIEGRLESYKRSPTLPSSPSLHKGGKFSRFQ
jgi:hypothetical protein